jgi:hypothetical protein
MFFLLQLGEKAGHVIAEKRTVRRDVLRFVFLRPLPDYTGADTLVFPDRKAVIFFPELPAEADERRIGDNAVFVEQPYADTLARAPRPYQLGYLIEIFLSGRTGKRVSEGHSPT